MCGKKATDYRRMKSMNKGSADALRAIRAKCLDCCGGSRKMVAACRAPDCALYPFRSISALGMMQKRENGVGADGQTDLFEMLRKEA